MVTRALSRRNGIAVLALAGILATVGIGYAAIPGGDGTIKGCYALNEVSAEQKGGGTPHAKGETRIVDSAENCRAYEKAISWNQQGPKGDQGPTGATGAKGDQGAAGAACLPTNPACVGPKGDKGDTGAAGAACLPTNPACVGPKGDTGPAGTSGLSGYEIVSKVQQVDSPDVVTALCPQGKFVLGGGAETSGTEFYLDLTAPYSIVGWQASVQFDEGQDDGHFFPLPNLTVWAICAKLG